MARWLNTVTGLAGRLCARGATVVDRLAISSDYHPYFFFGEMRALFRIVSRLAFGRPLTDFTLDGAVGKAALQRFCAALCPNGVATISRAVALPAIERD